jgi:acyl-CoA synthetase (AMP-forming)/AMP-acid ligase II
VAVGFWDLNHPSDALAVVADHGQRLSFAKLRDEADRFGDAIDAPRKTVGFVLSFNTPACLSAYLGALRRRQAVCLLNGDIRPDLFVRLVGKYSPDWIFSEKQIEIAGYAENAVGTAFIYRRRCAASTALCADLALLLPTSGSTGSPKLVRLSYDNLQANAASIVEYLGIQSEERCITSLPMEYSYGLSVVNTHLFAGAQTTMTTASILQRDFWDLVRSHEVTSLAGVPYHYDVLIGLKILEQPLPSMRTLTQAGGRLSPDRIRDVWTLSVKRGWQFFVMYGQTEATARMSYVPPHRLSDKLGSVGIPVPGGNLTVEPATQQLIYRGPNVMLGYAESRDDLSKGDDLKGTLKTGDVGVRDDEGYFYIVGRIKRFLKIFGKRFNLDEVENLIRERVGQSVACFGVDDRLSVAVEPPTQVEAVADVLKNVLSLNAKAFRITTVEAIPHFPNGKIDYRALESCAGMP